MDWHRRTRLASKRTSQWPPQVPGFRFQSRRRPVRRQQPAVFIGPNLDIVRFLAFFLVFIHHVLGFQTRLSRTLGEMGALGMCLFFFLSSYLITELLQREKKTTGRSHWQNSTIHGRSERAHRKFSFARGLVLLPVSSFTVWKLAASGADPGTKIWTNTLVQSQFFAMGSIIVVAER